MSILKKHNSFVAYFDMLGFKRATLTNIEGACTALTYIRSNLDHSLHIAFVKPIKTSGRIIVPEFNNTLFAYKFVRAFIFSDSILIFTLDNTADDLISLIGVSSRLFAELLVFKVPLRGGLAAGDFYVNESAHTFCGVPMVKAYELSEMSKWMGIIIDDQVAESYFEAFKVEAKDTKSLIKWQVPKKDGKIHEHWVFNWPQDMKWKIQPPIKPEQLYSVFLDLFKCSFEELTREVEVKEIYNNTTEFINYSFSKRIY